MVRDSGSRAARAGVLSLIIPGAGQIYSGTFWQGIFWMALTAVVWFNVGGLTGALCHVIAAITAWLSARRSDGKLRHSKKEEGVNAFGCNDPQRHRPGGRRPGPDPLPRVYPFGLFSEDLKRFTLFLSSVFKRNDVGMLNMSFCYSQWLV